MSTVRERLLKFIKEINLTTAEFERQIGVSSGYVNNISKSIQPDKLEIISDKFPQLNINWLLLNKGEMKKKYITINPEHEDLDPSSFTSIEIPQSAKELAERFIRAGLEASISRHLDDEVLTELLKTSLKVRTPKHELMKRKKNHADKLQDGDSITSAELSNSFTGVTRPRVPLTAAAGSLSGNSIGVTLEQCEQMPLIHQIPSYDFTMFIKGDSMSPRFESGDEIACRHIDQSRFIQWGKVHVLDTTQGFVIKRVYEDGDKIRCVSYNPEYADFSIPKEDILSMSLVVGVVSIMEM